MISHLFNRSRTQYKVYVYWFGNRCSKCCTSRKSGTGTLLFDGLYDVDKPYNCFYKMICSAVTHALWSVSHIC